MTCKRFVISVVSPFRLDLTVWALRRRTKNAIDQWDRNQYIRLIVCNNTPIKLSIAQQSKNDNPKIIVMLQSKDEIAPGLQKNVLLLIRSLLGLTIDLQPFYMLADMNESIDRLVRQFAGVRPPRFPSIFESLINAIACQQLTLDSCILLLNRFAERFGVEFRDGDKILYAFPRPEDLTDASQEDIRKLGFSNQKAQAIKELSARVMDNTINFAGLDGMGNKEAIEYLLAIRGIGRWSAEYVLLRGLGRLDTFPGDDVGARNNMQRLFHLDKKPNYEEIKKLTSQWHPYEGLVYFHLLLENLHRKEVI
jgi:DNA-3-methyladenine glycosylase II